MKTGIRILAAVFLAMLMLVTTAAAGQADLPEDLTVIESNAFLNDASLTGALVIPDRVSSIGAQAFANCTGLTSLTIPESVQSIGARAFAGCTSLSGTVTIPYGCSVAEDAFDGCTGITVVVNDKPLADYYSYTIMGDYVRIDGFVDEYMVNMVIPAFIEGLPVEEIGPQAFMMTDDQEWIEDCGSVTLPSTIRKISGQAFQGRSISSINLPEGLEEIGTLAFTYNEFTQVHLPASLKKLEPGALMTNYHGPTLTVAAGNTKFKVMDGALVDSDGIMYCIADFSIDDGTLQVPAGVTYLAPYALWGTSSSEVTLPEGLTKVGSYAFYMPYTDVVTIKLPSTLQSITYDAAEVVCDPFVYIVDENNPYYYSENGSLISADGTLIYLSYENYADEVTIPDGVKKIGELAAYDLQCSKVTLPASVTEIGQQSFSHAHFYDIVFSDGLKKIGDFAFEKCMSFGFLDLPESLEYIGYYAFEGCDRLWEVHIPESVTFIGEDAFIDAPDYCEFYVVEGSYAEAYLTERGFTVCIEGE